MYQEYADAIRPDYQKHYTNVIRNIGRDFKVCPDGNFEVDGLRYSLDQLEQAINGQTEARFEAHEQLDRLMESRNPASVLDTLTRATAQPVDDESATKLKKGPSAFILICGGLIKWYAEVSELTIDKAAEGLGGIPATRYYNYHDRGIYTDNDITQLGTSWEELAEKIRESDIALKTFIGELLRKARGRK